MNTQIYSSKSYFNQLNLPTTCIIPVAVAVEKSGASAVTSQEKLPDKPKPTLRMSTCVAFELVTCGVKTNEMLLSFTLYNQMQSRKKENLQTEKRCMGV